MNLRKLSKITLLSSIAALFLTGCGGPKFFNIKNDFKSHIQKNSDIGLIVDSCIFVDGMGDDNDMFSIVKAKEASNAAILGLSDAFKENGLNVKYSSAQTVCAYFEKPTLNTNLHINENEIIKGDLPYFLEEMDEEYKKALTTVLNATYVSSLGGSNYQKIFLTRPEIQNSLEILKNKIKQNKILVLTTFGRDVKLSKSLTQGLLTGVLTLGFVVAHEVDTLKLTALLIDLDKKEAIWSSAVNTKKPNMYNEDWYKNHYFDLTVKSITDNL